ncbi:MAG: insulinase family protein [Holophagales bacterium]|nr:insulinase family protein [Holophagales bacterium]
MTPVSRSLRAAAGVALALTLTAPAARAASGPPPKGAGWRIPTAVKTLPNGLTVVVSDDHSAPTFGLCMAYRIGFRLEPKGRTGFAHLFEHMMFQGTPNAPKGSYDRVIEGGGGINNGSTRYDYTNYIVSAPVSALEAVLWLEADRMKTLDFREEPANQKEVVKRRSASTSRTGPTASSSGPTSPAPPSTSGRTPTTGTARSPTSTRPPCPTSRPSSRATTARNNAVLAIVGDVNADEAFAKVEKYFGVVPARPAPPKPDVSEKANTKERTLSQTDPLANVPAVAIGWKMPARGTKDDIPAAVLGTSSPGRGPTPLPGARQGQGAPARHRGGNNWPLDDAFTYEGPTLLPSSASTSLTPPRRRSSPPSTPRSPPSRRARWAR